MDAAKRKRFGGAAILANIYIANYIPPPKKRPRFSARGGVYSPSSKGEQSLALVMRAQYDGPQITANIDIEINIYATRNPRGDLDNYVKFVYDALQKSGIIANDKQIRAARNEIVIGDEALHIIIRRYYERPKQDIAIEMRKQGLSYRKIAKALGVNHMRVKRWVCNKCYSKKNK